MQSNGSVKNTKYQTTNRSDGISSKFREILMSFYKQPLTYQCGPLALKYALVMLGKMEDEREIEEIAGSTWWQGTDEIGLEKAANYFDCDFEEIAEGADVETAFFNLRSNLRERFPVVLCVDKWSHWIAVVGFEKDRYVCVDSGMKKVIIILKEKELLKRWKYRDKNLDTFSGYALFVARIPIVVTPPKLDVEPYQLKPISVLC